MRLGLADLHLFLSIVDAGSITQGRHARIWPWPRPASVCVVSRTMRVLSFWSVYRAESSPQKRVRRWPTMPV